MKKVMMMIGMLMVAAWAFAATKEEKQDMLTQMRACQTFEEAMAFMPEVLEVAVPWWHLMNLCPVEQLEAFYAQYESHIPMWAKLHPKLLNAGVVTDKERIDFSLELAKLGTIDANILSMVPIRKMSVEQLVDLYTNILKNTPLNEKNKDFLSRVKGELLKLKDL